VDRGSWRGRSEGVRGVGDGVGARDKRPELFEGGSSPLEHGDGGSLGFEMIKVVEIDRSLDYARDDRVFVSDPR
jgi:hypothetical protein